MILLLHLLWNDGSSFFLFWAWTYIVSSPLVSRNVALRPEISTYTSDRLTGYLLATYWLATCKREKLHTIRLIWAHLLYHVIHRVGGYVLCRCSIYTGYRKKAVRLGRDCGGGHEGRREGIVAQREKSLTLSDYETEEEKKNAPTG